MKKVSIMNYICAVLAILFIVLQFIPFWNSEEMRTVTLENGKKATELVEVSPSIQHFTWFPSNFTNLQAEFDEASPDGFSLNRFALCAAVPALLFALIAVFFCIAKSDTLLGPVAALLAGSFGSCMMQSQFALTMFGTGAAPFVASILMYLSEFMILAAAFILLVSNWDLLTKGILAVVGALGIVGYAIVPMYMAGNKIFWILHLMVYGLLFVLSIVSLKFLTKFKK